MTPAATSPAARAKRVKRIKPAALPRTPARTGARSARGAGHRATARATTPSAPRRVSGPLGGVTGDARVARPSRPATRPQPRWRDAASDRQSLVARALAYARALPDHQLLDRVVRGRAWIPLLGVLLAGVVAMQVEVLKLSAGMGRSIELGSSLQSRNDLLRASVATLSDDQRIESRAATMGMVMPAPAAVSFLGLSPAAAVERAVANIHPPNPAGFAASLPPVLSSVPSSSSSSSTATATSSASTPPVSSTTAAPGG